MSKLSKIIIFKNLLGYLPILLLFGAVLNEFDFNYLELKYFSFNFPYILVFYWSLRKSESLGYGFIFIAGLINDVVVGFPIGISSLAYLLICGFAAYLRNITLRPSLMKDWFFFLITILVINSFVFIVMVIFFTYEINYTNFIVNLLFTFLFYIIFANIFQVYSKLVFGVEND